MKQKNLILTATCCVFLQGCVDRAAQMQAKQTAKIVSNPVQTVAVKPAWSTTLTRSLEITGEVTTSNDTQIGAKTAGRIVGVYVRDGDHVAAGQILARQDSTPLMAQLNQAQAQVLTAEAGLATANSQLVQALRNQMVNPYRTTASVVGARAALRAAQSNLNKLLAGARPQERSQAQASLNSAKANMDVQKKQLQRISTLVQQGALAGSQLDTQQATYEAALANYQNAQQAVSLLQAGTRQEDIDAARDQVAQARESLRTAQATKSLDPLYGDQVVAAKAGVASAKATIQNAQAQVVIARQGLSDAVIRAPFDGQISGKPVEVGTIATPGSPVIRIIGSQGVYFEGNVPSDLIDQIKVGLPVAVHVDAIGQQSFPAKVAAISPLGSSVGRLFNVRVQFLGAPAQIRPGMFASGNVQVQTIPNAIVVPAAAVVSQGEAKYVFVVKNGVARKAPVTTGLQQGDFIQVRGIPVGSEVVFQGQDRLTEGSKVSVQSAVKMTAKAQSVTTQTRASG